MLNYILPVIVAVLCAVSLTLLRRDRKEHPLREGETLPEDAAAAPDGKILWIYSGIMIALTLGASVLFCTVYADNNIFVSIKRLALLCVIWPVAYIDFKTYRIPNTFILFGLACRVVLLPFELLFDDQMLTYLISEVIAAGALLLACVLCALCLKGSIGFGDMKLFVVMGLLLGLDAIWSAVFTSLLISFVISAFLLITKKKTRKDAIPFGPAIVIGTYISVCLTGM